MRSQGGAGIAVAVIVIAMAAAAAGCRCSLVYGEPFWLYNKETGYFCGADCTSGGGARPCPMRCGPTLSRPTPLILDAPSDYAGVSVASPSIRCALRAENATRGDADRACVLRADGSVMCGIDSDGGDARWLVMVATGAEGLVRDGDAVMLLAVPDPSRAPSFSWCHVDLGGALSCDATQAPARGLFVLWRAP